MVSLKLSRQLPRFFSSARAPSNSQIKQVTRDDFSESLEEIKARISDSQFVGISLVTTGTYSSSWHNISSLDTPEIAYLKSKYAAERFQIFQLSICPFTICGSKVTAYPYGFHLFPRDEKHLGMPCYSFSCQSSVLKSLTSQSFDFNSCIYNGISYLSREQEIAALNRLGFLITTTELSISLSPPTVVDSIFCERTKSVVRHWWNTCKDRTDAGLDVLSSTLSKLMFPSEEYYSRPSLTINVNSERQAALVAEVLQQLSEDLVPLFEKGKEGNFEAVRVVLTSSNEDKTLLKMEVEESKEKQKKQLRGFREVIDFISDSQKPIVSTNSLNDLVYIYSKFLGSLPPTVDEFIDSINLTFPHVIDANNLMNAVAPQLKGRSITVALNHLKNHFFAPICVEIPNQVSLEDDEAHGHTIVMTAHLLAKLFHILKISPKSDQIPETIEHLTAEPYYGKMAKPFSFGSSQSTNENEVKIWRNSTRHIKCANLVFLWGFGDWMTARKLKGKLEESHSLLNVVFDVRLLEKCCAVLVFGNHDQAKEFLLMAKAESDAFPKMGEVFPEGLKAAGYDSYERVFKLGFWDSNLGDALEKALNHSSSSHDSSSMPDTSCHLSELLINVDDL